MYIKSNVEGNDEAMLNKKEEYFHYQKHIYVNIYVCVEYGRRRLQGIVKWRGLRMLGLTSFIVVSSESASQPFMKTRDVVGKNFLFI